MTDDERKTVKESHVPEDWKARPAKLRHKDRDTRWTVKLKKAKQKADGTKPPVDIAIPTYGYQNHMSIDDGFGFIRKWQATDAVSYEGAVLRKGLLDKTNTAGKVWAERPIAARRTRGSWTTTASSAASIARSPRASQ